MYKYLIDSAGNGLNGLALLALLTFFSILVIAFVAVFVRRRSFHDHMASLPLDDVPAPATASQTAQTEPS